uniref:Chromodomain helicase DNA binding protein 7 n=1 Tax=Seriola lalandi dorsalis TaxID=1841481 RepID=A0A3B4YM59_SERLL
MADPGMLSLFGDDAGLFSDGLDGLGGCFPQQPAPGQSNPLAQQTNPSLNHEHQGNRGQPKLGQMYDHGPYTGYEQSGAPAGRMMAQNGPTQGPPNVNPAMNGMASHYHNNPANSSNPCHGYPGDAGGGGGGGGGVWGQQQQQQQQQSRSAYQQPPTQPGGGPNQIGGYQMSQGNYGAQMRHPQPQPQPQGYPNMGHTPRYPHSPSRQPQHTHQHQQGMGGFGGSQYPGYQAQYGAIGPGMGQSANTNISTNTSQAMAPGQLGQRFNQGSGPAAGQQGQRYPPAPPHQPQPLQTHSTPMQQQAGQQGQPMHPLNHTQHPQNVPQSQNQPQSHLAPPAQGSYPSPSSMSPMRVLGTPTPPPQQGRPPSAGLAGPPEVAGYTALQSPPNAMPHPQRTPQTPLSTPHPQHQQPHNMPSNAGQMYPGIGPQRGPQMGPNRPQLQQQQGKHHTADAVPCCSEELLLSQFSKPKQKRHRCRNPNKIDINTLTGDERVPVVNRRNGRKMGGAMAPPMKELPRWLIENPEFSIAPDWTDIVKQSGFLPEAMFDRLLTGPVVREEGVRRRGRRPKSEIAKAAAAEQQAAIRGINPLLLNSLFGGMDLSSLQSLQSLQLAAGLMAFPAPTDPKQAAASAAAASMLPLMLPGMGGLPNMAAALPNMFSLGGLFGGNLSDEALTTKRKRKRQGEEKEGEAPQIPAIDSSAEASINGDAAALLAAAGMSANSLAFNPFLLSTMAPGLLYPSMFLPPGLGGLSLPGFPTASTLAELQSAMAGALGGNAVSTNPLRDEEEKGMKAPGEEDEDEDEEDGGGESDLAEEKDEGAEEETRGEADDSLLEDGGMGGEEEEATASPQKDKSD